MDKGYYAAAGKYVIVRESEYESAAEQRAALLEALRDADKFITNGIELGYIRMPDPDTADRAHATPGIVRAAIALAQGDAA